MDPSNASNEPVVRFMAQADVRGIDLIHRRVPMVVSNHAKDSYGGIIWQQGIDVDSRYRANPIFVWHHTPLLDANNECVPSPGPENLLGRAVEIIREPERTVMVFEFLPASVNPMAEMVFQMYVNGALNSCSIGMIQVRELFADGPEDEINALPKELRTALLGGAVDFVLTRGVLVEVSAVFAGATPGAGVMRSLVDRRMEVRERALCTRATKMMALFDEKMAALDALTVRMEAVLRDLKGAEGPVAEEKSPLELIQETIQEAEMEAILRAIGPYL